MDQSRIAAVQSAMEERLAQAQPQWREKGRPHLYGVAKFAALLAMRRGVDVELAVVSALLHDLAAYLAGDYTGHGPKGAQLASRMLNELGCFSQDEIAGVAKAIHVHDEIGAVHAPLDEVLKDADSLDNALLPLAIDPGRAVTPRLSGVLKELQADLRQV